MRGVYRLAAAAVLGSLLLASHALAQAYVLFHAPNNAALRAVSVPPDAAHTTIARDGFAAAGDGGNAMYTFSANPCSISGGAGDNGAQVQPGGGSGCWLADLPASGADARVWGVLPGGTDVTSKLQAAVTWACTNQATLRLAGGTFTISRTISMGNGTSSTLSTQNRCTVAGQGSGTAASETGPPILPTVPKWSGTGAGPAVQIAGPASSIDVRDIAVDCNAVCATGFDFVYAINSRWEGLLVTNWKGSSAFAVDSYPNFSGTGVLATGANHDTCVNCRAQNPVFGTGASGITIGNGSYAVGVYDVAQFVCVNCEFAYDSNSNVPPDTPLGHGIELQYTDSDTFLGGATQPEKTGSDPGGRGYGLYISPPSGSGGGGFPGGIAFKNMALIGGVNNPGSGWTVGHGVDFSPYPTGDGEPIPASNAYGQFYGVTDTGYRFGFGNGPTLVWGSGGVLNLAGSTTYIGVGCNGVSPYTCAVVTSRAGHLGGLDAGFSCVLTAVVGSGGSGTSGLLDNGSPTAVTCTIAATPSSCTDNADIVAESTGGHLLTVKLTGNSAAPSSTFASAAIGFNF